MEDCTESHQIRNDTPGEQSRSHVGTALPAAMGPCAPNEQVLHSSGFVVASEHAVTSGCFDNRVDCAASHVLDTSSAHLAWSQPDVGTQHANVGYPGVDFSMASKPVFLSSGLAVSNEHAVEVVDPDFHSESSAAV